MKIRSLLAYFVVCALIGAFFITPLFSAGASAWAQIMTPTFIPPSVTPSPVTNFVCPVGTPAGWGTYTPSALWAVECGNCGSVTTSTPTAFVPTPNPTYSILTQAACQTAAVGGEPCITPTPNITVTPAVSRTSTPVTGSLTCVSAGCIQDTPYSVHKIYNSVVASTAFDPSSLIVYVYNGSTVYVSYRSVSVTGYNQQPVSGSYTLSGLWAGYGIGTIGSASVGGVSSPLNVTGSLNTSIPITTTGNKTAGFARVVPAGMDIFYQSFHWEIWLSTVPIPSTSTPSPTVTPYSDLGFCSSVAPTIAEFGFNLFIPDGAVNCSMGWDEFGAGDFVVPAVQICFQPSRFGVIRLFNSDYEVGIFGLAAAAGFLWRFFRTV